MLFDDLRILMCELGRLFRRQTPAGRSDAGNHPADNARASVLRDTSCSLLG